MIDQLQVGKLYLVNTENHVNYLYFGTNFQTFEDFRAGGEIYVVYLGRLSGSGSGEFSYVVESLLFGSKKIQLSLIGEAKLDEYFLEVE